MSPLHPTSEGATDMESIITTTGLRKSFRSPRGAVEAVRGVSIDVARGEVFGFLGPNGAGKTTTLRMVTTLLPIDGGTATVAGFDVGRQPQEVRSRIGYVSQLGGADELATGRENLILQGRLYGGDLDTVSRRTQEVMGILDLAEFADRRVKTYSGGQRRRLDIALGIVHQPEVLFLDEPSTGLDPQNRANLWDHVRSLRDLGTTVFLTTHYLEEADALCDRLVIMDHGEIVVEGTPRDLKRQVAGESVVLSIREADGAVERAAAVLGAQEYAREITVEGDQVRLYVEDGGAALPVILRLLDAEGIGIRSMNLSEPTLDDVFLRQTGRSLRDAGSTPEHGGEAAA
jgi:ABC-2 type transport system ATP-binding protein